MPRPSVAATVLFGCAIVGIAHQALRWDWFIDDAAITFAYARNLANGHGLVPWPGGERVEAFSNPTWMLLLAAFQAVGLDGFTVAKPLGMGFGLGTGWFVWRTAQRALPQQPHLPLLAPVLLALNPQFAIWSASGLENALFAFLLAGGVHALLQDLHRSTVVRSATWFSLLVATRPEGVLYAAVAGAVVGTRHQGSALRHTGVFLGITLGTFAALTAGRLAYFAWPFPASYYAKIVARPAAMLSWTNRGWEQLGDFGVRLGHTMLLPVYVLGLTGWTHARLGWGVLAIAAVGLWLLEAPLAIGVLLVATGLWPRLGCEVAGHDARLVCWFLTLAGLGFSIRANGDWMGAYRWMSLVSPLTTVLLAAGLAELGVRRGGMWAVGAALLWVGWRAGLQTRDHVRFNRNETVDMVQRRTQRMLDVANTAFHEGPIVHLDPDLGGHLWRAPQLRQVDLAMLADVPMGRHSFTQTSFVRQYIFEERNPLFAHVHGWWAEHTGLLEAPEWERYLELPPYLDVHGAPHRGLWIRRDAVFDEAPGRVLADLGAVRVHPVRVPAHWAAGQPGYLEVPLSGGSGPPTDLSLFLERDGAVVAQWPIEPAYGWLPIEDWRPGEAWHGRQSVLVPELPTGRYTLGVAAGDAWIGSLASVVVKSVAWVHADAEEAVGAALQQARVGTCERAEATWVRAKRHRPTDHAWHESERPAVADAVARCWGGLAQRAPLERAVPLLVRARAWDRRPVRALGAALSAAAEKRAQAAESQGDWAAAYDGYAAAVAVAPWRSWMRRKAERARDRALGL